MIVYYFLFCVIPIFSVISYACNYKASNKISIFILLIISVIIGYRESHIGTDTENYIEFYINTPNNLSYDYLFNNGSPLFQIILFIFKKFDISTSIVLFFISSIFNVFFYLTLNKLNKISPSYFLIFITSLTYLLLSLNIIRQGLAVITFTLFVFSNSINPRKENYIFLVLSILFHPSAIFGFIVYFLFKKINLTTIKALLIIITSLAIISLNIDIPTYILSILKSINIMPNLIHRIEFYITDYNVEGSNIGIGYISTCIIGIISLLYKEKLEILALELYGRKNIVRTSINFVFINIAIYPILAPLAALARFSFYFYAFEIFLFCLLNQLIFKNKLIQNLIVTLIALILYVKAIVSGLSYGFL
ncbi:EpsG family protein [Providencia rettgeri]|uniref:EpsG family protein n=1 Tax=Providencia sp. PROV092 TaxID=2949808 RepID=UPI00234B97CB|nr:EpsG family protein [Providencia sp. PROV092]